MGNLELFHEIIKSESYPTSGHWL